MGNFFSTFYSLYTCPVLAGHFKPNEYLFPISKVCGGIERKTSKMLKDDLTCARNFWIAELSSPKEEMERLKSDFLKYKDSNADFADIHGFRHTFIHYEPFSKWSRSENGANIGSPFRHFTDHERLSLSQCPNTDQHYKCAS